MSISYSADTEVQKTGDLWEIQNRNREDTENAV